jgi:hypothetical protein
LLLHQGVVPGINLSNAIGCEQHWDATQACFTPTVDEWGATSVPGITIAGDAAGIAGARAAEARAGLPRCMRLACSDIWMRHSAMRGAAPLAANCNAGGVVADSSTRCIFRLCSSGFPAVIRSFAAARK